MSSGAFARLEFEARLAATRAAMVAAGLDALLVTDPSNMHWLTGYDGWSFYVHQGVVVSLSDDPLWWGRGMDAQGALRTVWMASGRIEGYPDAYVQSIERHPMTHLGGLLRDRGLGRARIGVEMDNYYYSAKAHAVLTAALPDAWPIDATGLVNWQRAVKSPAEIDYMRRAAEITAAMHATIRERFAAGMRKNDLVAAIYKAGIEGVGGAGGDYPAIVPMLPTGADAAAPHLTWDDRPLEADAGTFFEIAGCHRRYHAPLCRTAYLGRPPQALLDAEGAMLDALDAGIDAARAGATAGDVARAVHGLLAAAGFGRAHRCGYAVGLSYPPDWGERTISLRESDATELRPGMTFHLMPGLWTDDWGLEITETILIHGHGPAECLCDVPRGLVVKD